MLPDDAAEALPSKVTVLVGRVKVCAAPASATGGIRDELTVTVTILADDKPLLSATFNSN